MCATFTFTIDDVDLLDIFPDLLLDESSPFHKMATDAYPHSYASVIVREHGELLLTSKKYALTPYWSKNEKVKWATYNARMNRPNSQTGNLEFIYDAPTWKTAFGKKHCLVPISHFRESCHSGEADGHIVRFTPQDSSVLFAAGIYEDWTNPQSGEVISSFAIVTTEPDSFLLKVGHDRSPVFLKTEESLRWLESFKTPQEAYGFLETHSQHPQLRYELERKLKSAKKTVTDTPHARRL